MIPQQYNVPYDRMNPYGAPMGVGPYAKVPLSTQSQYYNVLRKFNLII